MPFDQLQVEEFGSKCLPYTPQSHRKMPLKRRKRKRVESTTDTATYMAHHNLFSYRGMSFALFFGCLAWNILFFFDMALISGLAFDM